MNWPLPLTVTEELLLVDDRPAYPCCFFVRAEFSGCFDQPTLEAAIRGALRQHPLLTAQVARRGRKWVWVPVDNPQPVIEWMPKPIGDGLAPATRIDLTEGTGIRFRVIPSVAASTLILQFHHAVCDGEGVFRFLHDLLIIYATARGQPPDEGTAPELEPRLLARRGKFGLTIIDRLGMAPRQIMNLFEAWQFVRRIPTPLLPNPAEPNHHPVHSQYPTAISARLTSEETAALGSVARKLGVTINDLLLRDLFLTCQEWRQSQGSHRRGEWLRIAVPVNLRKAHDHKLPAANVVGMLIMDRCDADFDDPGAFLKEVHREMNRNRQRQMGLTHTLATALSRHLPGGLKKHAWANKCLSSSVLTNLGIVFMRSTLRNNSGLLVAGGMTLETLDVLPPLRPHMAAGFAVGTYAGRLWITLHYDSRPMTEVQANDLLAIFLRRVRTSIGPLR